MTAGERDVLNIVGRHAPLPKSYFDNFPGKLPIAKNLMWRGLLEHAGNFGDCLALTPAGRAAINLSRK